MGNYADFLRTVKDDTEMWGEVGGLQKGQNLPIPSSTAGAVDQLAQKTLSASNIAWLAEKTEKTQEHVQKLIKSLKENDPAQVKETLSALAKLKEKLNLAANSGLKHLKSDTQQQPEIDQLSAQQKIISIRVVGEIDKHIINLGRKLQEMPSQPLKKEIAAKKESIDKLQEQSRTSRAFQAASNLSVGTQKPATPTSTIGALEDPTFQEKWAAIVEKKKDKLFIIKEAMREQAANPAIIPRILIIQEIARHKEGDVGPSQFEKDLHRLMYFMVNGKIEYDMEKTFKYNPSDAAAHLREACEKAVGKDNGTRLAERIASVINQGVFADMVGKIKGVCAIEGEKRVGDEMGGIASGQIWSVDIVGDKVVIGLKFSFALVDSYKYTQDLRPGAVMAERVFEIPISSLLATDEEIEKNPLPGVEVHDTYSQLIKSPAYAEAMLLAFGGASKRNL